MNSVALEALLEQEQLCTINASSVDAFCAGDGLRVIFFSGLGGKRSEGHDVAVALRELLRDYGGAVHAAVVDFEAERQLMGRFRVAVLPSLVFVLGGDTLEVMPRVRDWADYAGAFHRYLGPPPSSVHRQQESPS